MYNAVIGSLMRWSPTREVVRDVRLTLARCPVDPRWVVLELGRGRRDLLVHDEIPATLLTSTDRQVPVRRGTRVIVRAMNRLGYELAARNEGTNDVLWNAGSNPQCLSLDVGHADRHLTVLVFARVPRR